MQFLQKPSSVNVLVQQAGYKILLVFGWERIIVSSGPQIVDFRTLNYLQQAGEYMILIRQYCRKQSFVCTVGQLVCICRLWRQEVPALHPGQKGPDPLPVSCTGETPPGREAHIRVRQSFVQSHGAIVAEDLTKNMSQTQIWLQFMAFSLVSSSLHYADLCFVGLSNLEVKRLKNIRNSLAIVIV